MEGSEQVGPVYVYEPDEASALMMREYLSNIAPEVEVFNDLEKMSERIKEDPQRPSLLLMELRNKGGLGADIQNLDQISGRNIPKIITTSHNVGREQEIEDARSGLANILTKPFNHFDLEQAVRAAISKTNIS